MQLSSNSIFFAKVFRFIENCVLYPLGFNILSDLLFFCGLLRARKERTFLSALIKKFLGVLMSIPPTGKQDKHVFISLGTTVLLQESFGFKKKYIPGLLPPNTD